MALLRLICVLFFVAKIHAQNNTNAVPGRSAIVHLFEWKFSDIADECERFLAPKGFAGVQVSNKLDWN
jgi:alpha-amylase